MTAEGGHGHGYGDGHGHSDGHGHFGASAPSLAPSGSGIQTPSNAPTSPTAPGGARVGLKPRMTQEEAARMIQAMHRRKDAWRRVEAICEIEDLIFLRYHSLKEAFQQFDRSKDRKISMKEWSTRLRKLGYLGPDSIVKSVFEFLDADGSGEVTPKEFKQLQVHRGFRHAIRGSNIALRLILMRHPEADYSLDAYANGDLERQLTPHGTAEAVRMARLLAEIGWAPPENRMICLCSTARRCRQTVDFMIPYLPPFRILYLPDLYYPFTDPQEPSSFIPPDMDELFSEQVLRAILPCKERVSTVLIVGHNPLQEWFMSCRAAEGRKTPLVRLDPGDCALLQLAVAEDNNEADYINRKNRRPWLTGIFSRKWNILHHLEADPRDPPKNPLDTLDERFPAVGQWYDLSTKFGWNQAAGPPLIYTKKELSYLNTRCGYEVCCGKGIGGTFLPAIYQEGSSWPGTQQGAGMEGKGEEDRAGRKKKKGEHPSIAQQGQRGSKTNLAPAPSAKTQLPKLQKAGVKNR